MSEPVRLRGHHLICLQFFRGEGYSGAFVENLSAVLESLACEDAVIVEGADSVCAACPHLSAEGTCADERSGGEAGIRAIDVLATELLGLTAGECISLERVAERLASDADARERWRSESCEGCAWEQVCKPGWERLAAESRL